MLRLASRVQSLAINRNLLSVNWCDGAESQFSSFWLRSSVRDSRFFESKSLVYRPEHLNFINQEASIEGVEHCEEANRLKVHWPDHSSDFDILWLRAQDLDALPKHSSKFAAVHWNANGEIPVYEYEQRKEKMKDWMQDLRKRGLVYFQGIPPSQQGLTSVIGHIGPMKQRYHPTNVFTLQSGDRTAVAVDSSAYTPADLAGHTDTIYYRTPAKLTAFLGLEYYAPHQDTFNFFVDTFKLVEDLRCDNPEAFQLLTGTHIRNARRRLTVEEPCDPSEVPQYEWDIENVGPVVSMEGDSITRVQLRFQKHAGYPLASYDDQHMKRFRKVYQEFYESVHDPKNQQRIVIKPGTLVLCDNHRIVHGRGAVHPTTNRKLIGCFVSEEIFRSRCRLLLGRSSGLEDRWLFGCSDKSLEFLAETASHQEQRLPALA